MHAGHRFATLALLTALGCAHGTISPAMHGAVSPPPRSVAIVTVTLDPAVGADRRTTYDDLGANDAIAREIVSRLGDQGHYDPAGTTRLEVTVTNFRLRSTGNAFVNGFFAGVDILEGEVRVVPASGEPARYVFKLSGSEEMYFKFGAGARFRSLTRTLASRVAGLFG